ncbi:uncharacterized protein [Periplaneta americana]
MWEKTREDGTRKLKQNAIPTIFAFVPTKRTWKPPKKGKIIDLQITGIKTECMDHSYDVKTEMIFDETSAPIEFSVVKSEVEEGNVLDLHMTEIKVECMDDSHNLKSEITYEETSLPVDFSTVKTEVEVARDLNKVEDESRLKIRAEEDEVFTEG